jgi:hypothetical protein
VTRLEQRCNRGQWAFREVCDCGAHSDWHTNPGICSGWSIHHRETVHGVAIVPIIGGRP